MGMTFLGALGTAAAVSAGVWAAPQFETGQWGADRVLGTSFDLIVKGAGDVAAAIAGQEALREVARLEQVLSNWTPGSEIAALNTSRVHAASPDLFAVISACEAWRRRTSGAFSARTGSLPGQPFDALRHRLANAADVTLDPLRRRIHRPEPVLFDVDALAKGYIVDAALAAARRALPSVYGVLIDIGGDMRVWSAPECADPWRLAVSDLSGADNARPLEIVSMRNGALAASRAGPRALTASHPIRCGTDGKLPAGVLGAAATANSAADADALATALVAMDPRSARAFLNSDQEWSGLILNADGRVQTSRSWTGTRIDAPAQSQSQWPAGFELAIGLEIPDHGAGAERPYAVVWVTGEDRQPVRTLLVLGPQARWRESNYIYWRRIERLDAEKVSRMARQTRAPGRYDVIWDGRDDTGAPVPPGTYSINIEISREHGGHSYVSLPMTLGSAAMTETAEPSQELGEVSIRYGRRV